MKYGAILADCPWAFRTYSGKDVLPQREKTPHYETMPIHKIKELPVADMAARDCALFLWAVSYLLPEAIEVLGAWGFKYKTVAFVWEKPSIGMGYWTRSQSEICLLATRGSPRRKSRSVRQLISAPRREHSRKPDIYDRIEALVDGPYLEIFARQRVPGWDGMGDQLEAFTYEDKATGQTPGDHDLLHLGR